MLLAFASAALVAVLVSAGCASLVDQNSPTSLDAPPTGVSDSIASPSTIEQTPAIPQHAARALSDRVASDVASSELDDLYPLLHPESQKLMDEAAAEELLKQMEAYSGTILDMKLKANVYGTQVFGTWGNRPFWGFWYDLRTAKAEPGTYYLVTQIVSDEGRLSCANFRVVTYINKPDFLR